MTLGRKHRATLQGAGKEGAHLSDAEELSTVNPKTQRSVHLCLPGCWARSDWVGFSLLKSSHFRYRKDSISKEVKTMGF